MFILTFAVIGLSVFFYLSGMKTTLLFLSVFLSAGLFGQSPYVSNGIEYGQKGEYQEAIDDFTSAIKINPELALAYNNRGIAYGNLGKVQEAIDDFNIAVKMNPDDANAYYYRGISKAYLSIEYCSDFKKACELGNESGCQNFKIGNCN